MPRSAEQLAHAIHTLEAQRALLGDDVVDAAQHSLRAELSGLQRSVPGPQLRLVSVLFVDVVGSTAMSRLLDPEDIQAVMDGALSAFTTLIDQHGGRVMQYAGDSVLAAFGADEVREDDAERALLAGLALLRQGQLQAARVLSQYGQGGFGVRVGISSGNVLIGGGGVGGGQSIRGITVNIAARMEQTAPPGTLRISQDTWRLVRGLFHMQEQPPLLVKGRDEPMQTYLVHGAIESPTSAARRGVDGVGVPLLGRDGELQQLQAAFADVASGNSALVMVTVVAEAGLGKSRLLGEFGLWLQSQAGGATQLNAQASERRRGQPYGLMRDIFMNRLGLRVHDGSEAARWAWLHAAESVLGQRSNAAVLGHLLGLNFGDVPEVRALLDDARALRDRAFFHAFQWLAHTVASAKPLVVALDDLHWADEGSLAFFEQLQRSHSELPLLLIVLARPLLLERHPAWGSHGDSRRINLAPLDERASQALSRALLQHLPEVPAQLAQLVAQGAEGNPFFMEELVNMLIDQGAIEVQGTTWTLHPSRLSALQLPTTLNGVLQARLDVLPHDRRRALQLASVAGPVFWDQALQVLDVMAVAALPELTHRELIRPHEESRLVGMLEYEFRHHTVHRVAYESLLKGVKRAAHAVLARWLSEQPAAASLQDQIAEHHERGGERGLARDAWQRAADAARLRFANAEALAHAERALALTEEQDLPQRLALTLLQLRVFETLADRARLSQALAALQSLADLSGDAGWRSEAAAWRGRFEYHGGNALAALEHAQQAATLAPAADLERAARARSQEFFALARLGRHVQAQQSFEAALQLARQAGHATLEASIVNEQGNRDLGRGDVLAATAHWQQALAIHRQQGHLANMGGTLCNLAFAAMSVGDFDAAKTQFEEAHALCERVGQQQNAGIIGINLGIVLLHLQQPGQALQHACRALDLLRRSGDRWAEAAALRVAGQSEQALGQADAARARFLASRDLFDELNMGHLALEAIAALAEEALARGDVAAAKVHAEDIIARQLRGVSIEGADEPMRIPLAVWRALQTAGDARAHEALAAARRELLARADRLLDVAQRQRFLQAVAPHREIMAATGPDLG